MKKRKFILLTNKKIGLIVLLILTMGFVPIHKYYVSLTEVRIDTQKKTVNVSCKMFTDDLEDALFKTNNTKYDLTKNSKDKATNDALAAYINTRFKVLLDDKPKVCKYIGYEIEDDAVWCYLEFPAYKREEKIRVINSLLFDYLPEQINVVQLYVDKNSKSEKLVNPNMKAEFEL